WNSTQAANGSHGLSAKAYDGAGNSRTSGSSTVTVSNGTTGSSGVAQWVRNEIGSGGAMVNPMGVVSDHANNMVVAGYFNNNLDLGNGSKASLGMGDIFIAKYNAQNAL